MATQSATRSRNIPRESVRWDFGQLTFEVCSNDPDLLARAAVLFRPWTFKHSGASHGVPSCFWQVEPVSGESSDTSEWEIRSPTSSKPLYRGSAEGVLAMLEHLAILAVRDRIEGWPDLHGALVSKNGKGVMILGAGEAGKSTLACALWQSGWSLLCDDLTLVEVVQCMAYPVPRRVSLRHASRPLFTESLLARILSTPSCSSASESTVFHPDEVDRQDRPASARLEATMFLGRNGSAQRPGLLHRINPANALLALLPYSSRTRHLDLGMALQLFKPLAEAIPAYDLLRGSLADMVGCIEKTVRQGR